VPTSKLNQACAGQNCAASDGCCEAKTKCKTAVTTCPTDKVVNENKNCAANTDRNADTPCTQDNCCYSATYNCASKPGWAFQSYTCTHFATNARQVMVGGRSTYPKWCATDYATNFQGTDGLNAKQACCECAPCADKTSNWGWDGKVAAARTTCPRATATSTART
jgi:hypothetical protein